MTAEHGSDDEEDEEEEEEEEEDEEEEEEEVAGGVTGSSFAFDKSQVRVRMDDLSPVCFVCVLFSNSSFYKAFFFLSL